MTCEQNVRKPNFMQKNKQTTVSNRKLKRNEKGNGTNEWKTEKIEWINNRWTEVHIVVWFEWNEKKRKKNQWMWGMVNEAQLYASVCINKLIIEKEPR